jgi:hypothetical protein
MLIRLRLLNFDYRRGNMRLDDWRSEAMLRQLRPFNLDDRRREIRL